ncbi:MAG TPA: hypothetical protein VKY74_10360, partial [Chloroflexia bacterium]|nr:hypothetical protein [Chloroflexia bacterium]
MAEETRHLAHDPEHARRSPASAEAAGAHPQAAAPLPPAWLADPLLAGRGNGPVRAAGIQQLQRTAGNRAARRLVQRRPAGPPLADRSALLAPGHERPAARAVQRYKTRTSDQYTRTASAVAGDPAPFTEKSPDIGVAIDAEAHTASVGYATTNPAAPTLKVADDDSMAINATANEPKEFYARPGVVASANTALAAINSPVEFYTTGSSLRVNDQDLDMVQPKKRGKDIVAGQYANFGQHVCIDVATSFMGKQDQSTEAVFGDRRQALTTGNTDSQEVNKLAKALATVDGPATAEDLRGAMRGPAPTAPVGEAYGRALGGGAVNAKAETLGVNQFARAQQV